MYTLDELILKLRAIKKEGYIPSLRRSSTGIGFTIETKLDVKENRFRRPNFDVFELKAKRINTNSKSSLFVPQWFITKLSSWKEVVEVFGHW